MAAKRALEPAWTPSLGIIREKKRRLKASWNSP